MTSSRIGVYGKIDTQGDFVRAGSGAFAASGLDRWLEESVGGLKASSAALPEGAVGFLLSPPGQAHAFLGSFAPSVDSVGREFPLLVFVELERRPVETAPAVAATDYASAFVHAAGALVSSARGLSGADLTARAVELGVELPMTSLRGDEVPSLASESSQPLRDALGRSAPALAYALRTLGLACDQQGKTDSTSGGLTIDAPAPTPGTRAMWIDLALRRLRRARAASPGAMLWTDGPAGRLLLCLGVASPSLLTFWANPRHRSQRLWPLATNVIAATATALGALTTSQRRVVEEADGSLAELASEFS